MTRTITIDVLKRPRARLVMVHYPSRTVTIYRNGKPHHYSKVSWSRLRYLCEVLTAPKHKWVCVHRNDYALSYGYTEVITL